MGAWQMTMTCPNCGGELDLQANGRASEGGQRLVNVLRCSVNGCSRQWVHTQTLRSMTGAELDGAA